MSNTSLLGAYGAQDNSSLLFRNKVINGNFDIWQRGTSQTDSGYGSDDRWINDSGGSPVTTKTHSQQAFAVGQTEVPGNPKYFSRTVVTTGGAINSYCIKAQRIESVRTLAGQTATLSFWAKADATKNMAIEFVQYFGTGGSPSAPVTGINPTTIALTTSWKYYTVTVNIPSIAGKTLGTTDDGSLALLFWLDAGSNQNARTNGLANQSGTFDIAQVQMEAGPVATPFEHRPYGLELSLCQRYFVSARASTSAHCYFTNTWMMPRISFPVTMRNTPAVVFSSSTSGLLVTATANAIDSSGTRAVISTTGTPPANSFVDNWYTADAEL